MVLTRLLAGFAWLTLGCAPALAPEPSQAPDARERPAAAQASTKPLTSPASPTLSAAQAFADRSIRVAPIAGPVPWTHLAAKNGEDAFQFAIVTDRTGGMRQGVFDSAVQKLNLLEPEFVISVGDLIEGYTENQQQLRAEWDEFDGLVRGLAAPFFYVPGNHDLSNDVMRETWRERYGPSYYSFVYKNVLFLCLNSMDGELHRISDTQVAWLASELQKHQHVRWTLVFLHTPLWDDPSGNTPDTSKWAPIEAALGARRYTVFAGHHHRYVKRERGNHKYFTLATTGGGSALRGPGYGEFDHVVWVTMTRAGPEVANLMLDGIRDEAVRTDAQRAFQNAVLRDDTLQPSPIY